MIKVYKQEGIHQKGHATAEKFIGDNGYERSI